MRKSVLLLIAFIFITAWNTQAQDTVFTKKSEIICKVTEIGLHEIKYKDWDNLEGPNIVIRKSDVVKIVYQNGKEQFILPDEYDMNKEAEILDKTSAVKFALFSPIFNKMEFTYEKSLKVGSNIETRIGFIGLGSDNSAYGENVYGGYVGVGYKFLLGKDFYIDGMRYVHPLKGRYLKFMAFYSSFREDNVEMYASNSTYNNMVLVNTDIIYNSIALTFNYGRQFILGNQFTFDYSFGLGYGYGDRRYTHDGVYDSYHYTGNFFSHVMAGDAFCITGNMTLGYIF